MAQPLRCRQSNAAALVSVRYFYLPTSVKETDKVKLSTKYVKESDVTKVARLGELNVRVAYLCRAFKCRV